jgi:hypothetical protein
MANEQTSVPKIDLFPHLAGRELLVAAGEYAMLEGTEEPLAYNANKVVTAGTLNPLPGVTQYGKYREANGLSRPIVSFRYHKLDAEGQLEDVDRVIIQTGIGYGEHDGHPGQPPTWYLVGPQISTLSRKTGLFTSVETDGAIIQPKHFSVACITDGPLGQAILANGQAVTKEDFRANGYHGQGGSTAISWRGLMRLASSNPDFPLRPVRDDPETLFGNIPGAVDWYSEHKSVPSTPDALFVYHLRDIIKARKALADQK